MSRPPVPRGAQAPHPYAATVIPPLPRRRPPHPAVVVTVTLLVPFVVAVLAFFAALVLPWVFLAITYRNGE